MLYLYKVVFWHTPCCMISRAGNIHRPTTAAASREKQTFWAGIHNGRSRKEKRRELMEGETAPIVEKDLGTCSFR